MSYRIPRGAVASASVRASQRMVERTPDRFPGYPDTCSECGAAIVGPLVVDKSIPVYACAHAGNAHRTMSVEGTR